MIPSFRYFAFGLKIYSEIDLGEIDADVSGPHDVTIRLGVLSEYVVRSTPGEEFVRYRGVGAFRIRGGVDITADLVPEASSDLLRVLLMGRLMAYLLRQRGWLPVHASAVRVGDGAILFVAPVGTGKSTTAAGFYARGYEVLSDDVSPVRITPEGCIVQPGRPRLRLCEDAADIFRDLDPAAEIAVDKLDFRLSTNLTVNPLPVKRIYLLENGEEFRLDAVSSLTALVAIGKECFVRLQFAGPAVQASHLLDCAAISNTVTFRRLIRPRSLALLDQTVRLVEDDLTA